MRLPIYPQYSISLIWRLGESFRFSSDFFLPHKMRWFRWSFRFFCDERCVLRKYCTDQQKWTWQEVYFQKFKWFICRALVYLPLKRQIDHSALLPYFLNWKSSTRESLCCVCLIHLFKTKRLCLIHFINIFTPKQLSSTNCSYQLSNMAATTLDTSAREISATCNSDDVTIIPPPQHCPLKPHPLALIVY